MSIWKIIQFESLLILWSLEIMETLLKNAVVILFIYESKNLYFSDLIKVSRISNCKLKLDFFKQINFDISVFISVSNYKINSLITHIAVTGDSVIICIKLCYFKRQCRKCDILQILLISISKTTRWGVPARSVIHMLHTRMANGWHKCNSEFKRIFLISFIYECHLELNPPFSFFDISHPPPNYIWQMVKPHPI